MCVRPVFGLNARFRFYRYDPDDFFKSHGDGIWFGCISCISVPFALNSDFTGGATRFRINADDPFEPVQRYNRVKEIDVYTAMGDILCFPHGINPLHWTHSGETTLKAIPFQLAELLYNYSEEEVGLYLNWLRKQVDISICAHNAPLESLVNFGGKPTIT